MVIHPQETCRGDSPRMKFSFGPSGQLKLFQMVDLLLVVREE